LRSARDALTQLGHATTTDYLAQAARSVLDATGLLPAPQFGFVQSEAAAATSSVPHAGVDGDDARERVGPALRTRRSSFSLADEVCRARRLESTATAAGRVRIAYTSGLLNGIGETRSRERIEASLALRAVHDEHGTSRKFIHPETSARQPAHGDGERTGEPDLRTTTCGRSAVARLVFGAADV
jgi:FO synthase